MKARAKGATGGKKKNVPAKDSVGNILQFKIILRDIEPAIWRRVQVQDEIGMRTFAVSLLLAMGWKNSHLHEFIIGGKHYGMMTDEALDMIEDMPLEDEMCYKLKDFSEEQLKKFTFLYDFGDSWEHDVVFEGVVTPEAGVFYPRCTAGARELPS